MASASTAAGGTAEDVTGPQIAGTKFEQLGVETVAESERTGTPWTFVGILLGSSVTLANVIFGWVAVALGLSFWSALSAITVGVLVGMVLAAPLAVIGSYAATNNSTASGAHFGVRGRLIGSAIGLAIALVFTALGTWTAGDAIVSVAHRLFATPESDALRALSYGVVAAVMVVIALWGYYLLLRFEILLCLIGVPLLALMVVALAGRLGDPYSGGEYVLGSYWKTWLLATVVVGVAGPLTLVTVMGDWSRYVSPSRYPLRKFLPIAMGGLFVSLVPPMALGALAAVTFDNPFGDFVPELVNESPTWYVVLLLPLAVLGGIGIGAQTMYSCGLDLEAMLPRMSRLGCTIVASAASVALVFLGAFAFDASEAISATSSILVAIIAPWAAITAIGFVRCRGKYSHEDLQVFNRGQTGGRYWFLGGWNWRAASAYAAGAAFGVVAIETTLYTGPLSGIAGGIDVSFIGPVVISGVLYLALIRLFGGEPAVPEQSRPIADPTVVEELASA
jgi:purine-cytosine permease-like protein